jgi:hypothetical protein
MMSVFVAFLLTLKSCAQSGAALQLEVLALRHQVQVLERSRPPRLRLTRADRLLWVWSATQPSLSQPLTNQRNLAIDASGRWWSSEWSVFLTDVRPRLLGLPAGVNPARHDTPSISRGSPSLCHANSAGFPAKWMHGANSRDGKRYVRQPMPVYGHHMLKAYTELPAAMITN